MGEKPRSKQGLLKPNELSGEPYYLSWQRTILLSVDPYHPWLLVTPRPSLFQVKRKDS